MSMLTKSTFSDICSWANWDWADKYFPCEVRFPLLSRREN